MLKTYLYYKGATLSVCLSRIRLSVRSILKSFRLSVRSKLNSFRLSVRSMLTSFRLSVRSTLESEISVGPTFINFRTFSQPYAPYSGPYVY